MAESCSCGACTVPVSEIIGPASTEAVEAWAYREGVELCSTWNGRTAISVDDATAVFERASAAAEAARQRNQAKSAEQAAALPPVIQGRALPPGLEGVDALSLMKSGERDERLEKLDKMFADFTEGGITYHPIRDEG